MPNQWASNLCPRINAAADIGHEREVVCRRNDIGRRSIVIAPSAVVAEDKDVPFAREFVQAIRYLSHWDIQASRNLTNGELVRLAHIQQCTLPGSFAIPGRLR